MNFIRSRAMSSLRRDPTGRVGISSMDDSVIRNLTTDHNKAARLDVVPGPQGRTRMSASTGASYNAEVGSWAGRPLAASLGTRGRKVRTPLSSVPDNVREVGVK